MSSSSSLSKARAALSALQKQLSIPESHNKKEGVIFLLSSPDTNKSYVGSEYAGNIEKHLKELILRAEAYREQGSIFHDSYPVISQPQVRFELLEKVYVVGNRRFPYDPSLVS